MSATYGSLFELTSEGLQLFTSIFKLEIAENSLDLRDPLYAQPIVGTTEFEVKNFETAKEMALAICNSMGTQSPQALAGNIGLWSWLTFVLIDCLFPVVGNARQRKEVNRWYPAPPNDYHKAQRHLVRMPVLLFASLGESSDHLICGKPSVGSDIREQLTSQQDMFSANFQQVCRMLYFDENKNAVKRGAGSKDGPGIPRRLASIRRQLDVTWDMTDLSADRILNLLPSEFDGFRAKKH